METIKTYLENMFKGLPDTVEIQKMREELLNNMEEKYNELKSQGKSENEAVGIVISEFGNIDELMKEMGLDNKGEKSDIRIVSIREAEEYVSEKKKSGMHIGIGAAFCVCGTSILILMIYLSEVFNIDENIGVFTGLAFLLVMVAIAVAIFIISGIKLEKYKYLEEGDFELDFSTKQIMENQRQAYIPKFAAKIIVGVVLCIFGVLPVIFFSMLEESGYGADITLLGVIILLLLSAVAVILFISAGNRKGSYDVLLHLEEHSSAKKKEEDKVISIVASIVWPLTVVAFLLWGFVFGGWGISWILFPIVGILFGAFSGVYNSIKGNN